MKMNLLVISSMLLAALAQGEPPQRSISVDFQGKGKPVAIRAEVSLKDKSATCRLVAEGQELVLSGIRATEPDKVGTMKTVTPFADSANPERQLLLVTSDDGKDRQDARLIGWVGGKLKELGKFDLQGKLEFPGNGSMIRTDWMGFWHRTTQWSLDSAGRVALVPQEISWVGGVKGKVRGFCDLLQDRTAAGVLTLPRIGSEVEVVGWAKAKKPTSKQRPEASDWYLIRTESNLLGWVRLEALEAEVELPWVESEEVLTLTAMFVAFAVGDAAHFGFKDKAGKEWDFADCEAEDVKFGEELADSKANSENQGWGANKALLKKWFDLKYVYRRQRLYVDGPLAKVPVIIEAKMRK